MSYTKTTWVNNTTPINDTNLNKIEQGIYDNSLVVDAVTNTLNPTDTETYKTAELTEGQITDVIGVSDILIKGQTSQDGTPTPSAPVDVNVVSGSNVINTSNKNLLNFPTLITTSLNNVTMKSDNGKLVLNGTPSATPTSPAINLLQNIKLEPNQKITLSVNNSTGIGNNTDYVSCRLGGFVNNTRNDNIFETKCTSSNAKQTFTVTQSTLITDIKIRGNTNVTFNNFIIKPQIELGTTTTTYEPHQGKELPLDLGSIELCKIGDYQDYFYKSGSKWYLVKNFNKYIEESNDAWRTTGTASGSTTNTMRWQINKTISGLPEGTYNQNMLCNYFKDNLKNTMYGTDVVGYNLESSEFSIRLPVEIATTVEGVAQYFSQQAKPLMFYYQIVPTTTEITDTTLISQLEVIYNAPLYAQTNITQTNNDLPMVLDITACKDNINGIKAFIRK